MPEAFCGLETVRQKTPWTLCALWEKKLRSESICLFILFRGYFSFSQIYTEEQNTQHSTETLSQPISQNLTATFSCNALWTLSAEGVLWARNCAPKISVNSVCSVREKTPQRVVCVLSHTRGCVLFLTEKHRWTEHTAFHRDIKSTDFTEPYSHL